MTTSVFLVLLAAHPVGDWVARTDWQATNKRRSWAALAAHVASYHLIMGLLLLLPILRDGWPAGKALAALNRLGRDPCRHRPALAGARAPARAPASAGFATVEWGVIAVDQALHLFILAMLALLLG